MTEEKTPKDIREDAEELDSQNEDAAEALSDKETDIAESVVDKDAERAGDENPGELDVVDDVVAESAERRKRSASSEEDVRQIEEAEAVRIATETKLPDTPNEKVQVAVSDARVIEDFDGDIEVKDGVATVTREQAVELKLQYPKQVRIL